MNCEVMIKFVHLSIYMCYSCMLSVVSRCFGQVDASDSKSGYLYMLDSGFMSPVPGLEMTETTKSLDVLLPLRRKQLCYVYMSFALFTLRILLNAIIRCLQLNTNR